MMKRTIKPAAGESSVTAAAAKAAARLVYRDSLTGKLVVVERRRNASGAGGPKPSASRKR